MTLPELIQARQTAGAAMLAADRAYQRAVVLDLRNAGRGTGDLPASEQRQQLYDASRDADAAYVAAHKAVVAFQTNSDREKVAQRLQAAIA